MNRTIVQQQAYERELWRDIHKLEELNFTRAGIIEFLGEDARRLLEQTEDEPVQDADTQGA